MIVPQYWAEGRVQDQIDGRQVTVRRFGWSDESQTDAQSNADRRAREALSRIAAGEPIARREPKRPYNGAAGVPIREEIVERHGDCVITRNSYGALCLNTPDVLFADIDFDDAPSRKLILSVIGFLLVGGAVLGWAVQIRIGIAVVVLGLLVAYPIAAWLRRMQIHLSGGPESFMRAGVTHFLAAHPEWHLRLYRTPAGLRLLAMHKTFDPSEPIVAECFRAVRTDAIYVRMCLRQHCFRARVSPKPWRVGIGQHLRPRPGIWPIDPARLPERQRWVEDYERVARSYASCQFVEALGSGIVDRKAAEVQRLHDDLCQANRPMKMA